MFLPRPWEEQAPEYTAGPGSERRVDQSCPGVSTVGPTVHTSVSLTVNACCSESLSFGIVPYAALADGY